MPQSLMDYLFQSQIMVFLLQQLIKLAFKDQVIIARKSSNMVVKENLTSVADHRNHQMSTFTLAHNSINNVKFSPNAPIDIMDKPAAVSPVVKDEKVMVSSRSLPFPHGPYINMDHELPNGSLQLPQPLPQFQPPQMAQIRPLHSHLDSQLAHMRSQVKFLGSEPTFNHDSPIDPVFSSNMIHRPLHQPNIGIAEFDIPSHHSALRQIQMSGNHTQVLPHFPRGGPFALHGDQAAQMHGRPLATRQPNFSCRGLPMPSADISSGGNPPQAYQRLVEMELGTN